MVEMSEDAKAVYNSLYQRANEFEKDARFGKGSLDITQALFIGQEKNFRPGLPLFVGRETNGTGRNRSEELPSPFKWYGTDTAEWLKSPEGYYYNTSPFWRIIGHSLESIRHEPYGDNIFHDFLWSNLYKIAPRGKGRNVHQQRLHTAQVGGCANLILDEIDDLKPEYVVFITGYAGQGINRTIGVWQERKRLVDNEIGRTGKFVLLGESGHKYRCLVVLPPRGRDEQHIVDQIVAFAEEGK